MNSERFIIPTMDCAAEESEIRRALDPVQGIESLQFHLGSRMLSITAAPEVIQVALKAIGNAGFKPEPESPLAKETAESETAAQFVPVANTTRKLLLALVLALTAEGIGYFGGSGLLVKGMEMLLAAAAIGLAGLDTYRKGVAALLRGRLNINALMSVAVTGAFLIGEWPEAGMVMALYAIAETIEARSVDRARNAIRTLMTLAPEQAEMQQADGRWLTVQVKQIPLESILRIRPGERLPLDGVITSGSSAINQAPVTGESLPVDKTVGEMVFAGTINETAELQIRVTAGAADTTLARIIHSVEQAQGTRAPTQRFVDRFAAFYTPAVFVLAVATALILPLAFDWPWLAALYKALVLLVVACPCALVISTPVTVVSALASAAKRGVLIKGGVYLEEARKIKVIALDKTGTITEGKPRLIDFTTIAGFPAKTDVATLAAGLARRSDHPVSRAIAAGLPEEGADVSDFKALAGRGVEGTIHGLPYVLGNHRLIEELGLCSPALEEQLKAHEDKGRTVTLIASKNAVLGIFAVADAIKPTSEEAISELRSLGISTTMLTGDNVATARAIASQAGVDDAQGNLLPEDKLTAIKGLQERLGFTAMSGDGINDAPALATADIGIAMGAAGTDTAIEAADIVVMNDDLRRIPEVVRLSRKTHVVLWQNILLALGIKGVFLVLTLFGNATMWMAVFADMGASLIVVANGLRLLRVNTQAVRQTP